MGTDLTNNNNNLWIVKLFGNKKVGRALLLVQYDYCWGDVWYTYCCCLRFPIVKLRRRCRVRPPKKKGEGEEKDFFFFFWLCGKNRSHFNTRPTLYGGRGKRAYKNKMIYTTVSNGTSKNKKNVLIDIITNITNVLSGRLNGSGRIGTKGLVRTAGQPSSNQTLICIPYPYNISIIPTIIITIIIRLLRLSTFRTLYLPMCECIHRNRMSRNVNVVCKHVG